MLFIGDSITDAGRDRSDSMSLGYGYVRFVADEFRDASLRANVTVLNRGIGGDRVADLRRRWTADCIDLKPNVVSVLIGINDTWRRYESGELTTLDRYEADYRFILDSLRGEVDSQLVLIEPFLLCVRTEQEGWRVDLDPRIRVVNVLAAEYEAIIVRADRSFHVAAEHRPPIELADDGVHPTELGHRLLAAEWMAAVGLQTKAG